MTLAKTFLFGASALLVATAASNASAQSTIRNPGDHPNSTFEIEPKFNFGFDDYYGGEAWGFGARASFTILKNGFVPSINNSVAIGVGLDFDFATGCYYTYAGYGAGCNTTQFELPVVMQWNFFLTRNWSVFAEPGLFLYHGFFNCSTAYVNDNGVTYTANNCPSETSVLPAFYLGARYRFNDTLALTMRAGYPDFSIGLSIFP